MYWIKGNIFHLGCATNYCVQLYHYISSSLDSIYWVRILLQSLHYRDTIWDLRMREIEHNVLCNWDSFTIWNAGKQGRKFYRSLSQSSRKKVVAFCDVDVKKIGSFYTYEEAAEKPPKPRVPILHFKDTTPPLIICMKMVYHYVIY